MHVCVFGWFLLIDLYFSRLFPNHPPPASTCHPPTTHFGHPQAVSTHHQLFQPITSFQPSVTTLFLLLLLLWTFELYLILSYRYDDLLISWSYLLILSWRSYLLIYNFILISWSYHLMMIQDMFLYINFTLLLTCIWHAFDSCLSLMIDMHSTHVAAQHAFTICFTCVCLEDNTWTLVYNRS